MYILILFLSLGYGQKQITFQEFNSQSNCQSAIEELSKLVGEKVEATCLPK